MATDWVNLLEKFQVKDLIQPNFQLIDANSGDNVIEVLKLLTSKNIFCVPVRSSKESEYIGFVDIVDLVNFITFLTDMKGFSRHYEDGLRADKIDWFTYLSKELNVLGETTIADIIEESAGNSWLTVKCDEPLSTIMERFSNGVSHHRIPVANNKDIVGIITQSRVINFLSKQLPKVPHIANRTLRDWYTNNESEPVPCINSKEKAVNAFRTMVDKRVSGLAVVNDDGIMIGCISASDIKRSNKRESLFHDLNLPVYEYLLNSSSPDSKENTSLDPICCTLDDTIEQVLQKLSSKHIHRLFIVDKENRPQKVVTLCDILNILQKPNGK